MSLVFLENCSHKKCGIAIFVNWRYSIFLSVKTTNGSHSSLIANMAITLINFQAKIRFDLNFSTFFH